jgi:hypothetical protein
MYHDEVLFEDEGSDGKGEESRSASRILSNPSSPPLIEKISKWSSTSKEKLDIFSTVIFLGV